MFLLPQPQLSSPTKIIVSYQQIKNQTQQNQNQKSKPKIRKIIRRKSRSVANGLLQPPLPTTTTQTQSHILRLTNSSQKDQK